MPQGPHRALTMPQAPSGAMGTPQHHGDPVMPWGPGDAMGTSQDHGDQVMPWEPGDAMGLPCQDTEGEQQEEQLGCFERVGRGEKVSGTLWMSPRNATWVSPAAADYPRLHFCWERELEGETLGCCTARPCSHRV